jgi:predicted phage-related endonuclease
LRRPDRTQIPKPAERDAWLAARRPFFNASATSILFDRHPYMTPGDYATIKLTGEEQAQTQPMVRGQRLEDAIATWWGDEYEHLVAESDLLWVCGPLMATVDRLTEDDIPVEIKTANRVARDPEPYWLDQCQSIMACVGAEMCELVWFDSTMELRHRTIDAAPDLQDEILVRAERFMAAIELGIVPDWIDLSYSNVAELHPHPSVPTVALDDDALALVRELDTCRRIKRDADKDERVIKDRLAKVLADAEAGTWGGFEVVSWRPSRPGLRLDVDMLTADHPDLVEKYLRPTPAARRMLVKLEGPYVP